VERERGLSGGLRAVDLDDPATWESADTERDIQSDGPGRDHCDGRTLVAPEAHDGTLAELTIDLGEGCFEGLLAVCGRGHFRTPRSFIEMVRL
jgi:hypothetical protein